MKLTCLAGAVFAALVFAQPSFGRSLNFSSLSAAGSGFEPYGVNLTVDGFRFASSGGIYGNQLGVWQNDGLNHPIGGAPATSLLEYYAGAETTMTDASGALFSVSSIDLASWAYGDVGSTEVTFLGTKVNHSVVQQSFTLINPGNANPYLQHFVFDQGFSNLTSLSFTQGVDALSTAYQFNNIEVAAVPEPLSATLLLAGLPFVLVARRLGRRT